MVDARSRPLPPGLDEWPPTQDDLPYEDDEPVASYKHDLQAEMLTEPLRRDWAPRQDRHVFVGSDMFVYFRPDQQERYGYRGPDLFVALDVPPRTRKSWLVWEEGKGPDVVVELLSDSTAQADRETRFEVYRDHLRVPEYFIYDPIGGELAGYRLNDGTYVPIEPDSHGRLFCRRLNLWLTPWEGEYGNEHEPWVRWGNPDGSLLPLSQELASRAQAAIEAERRRAEEERLRAEAESQRAAAMAELLERYRQRFGELPE